MRHLLFLWLFAISVFPPALLAGPTDSMGGHRGIDPIKKKPQPPKPRQPVKPQEPVKSPQPLPPTEPKETPNPAPSETPLPQPHSPSPSAQPRESEAPIIDNNGGNQPGTRNDTPPTIGFDTSVQLRDFIGRLRDDAVSHIERPGGGGENPGAGGSGDAGGEPPVENNSPRPSPAPAIRETPGDGSDSKLINYICSSGDSSQVSCSIVTNPYHEPDTCKKGVCLGFGIKIPLK